MYEVKQLGQARFDEIAAARPEVFIPIEQSPVWDAFDHEMGGRTYLGLFGYYDGQTLVATARATLFEQRMRNMVLMNMGPVWFVERTPEREHELLETMRRQFADKPASALFIRLQVEHDDPQAVPSLEPFNYDRAIWVDISPDEEALMASFSSTTRRRIRQAAKKGVQVREIPVEERVELMRGELQPIMDETAERNAFEARAAATYPNLLKALPENAKLFVAYVEGAPVCWLISTEYRGHACYPYAAGNSVARETFASFLLQWEAIKDMKARDNTTWDMTGVESENFPGMRNVTQFKRGFSKNEVELPLVRDVPVSMAKYKALTTALKANRTAQAALRQVKGKLRG